MREKHQEKIKLREKSDREIYDWSRKCGKDMKFHGEGIEFEN